MHSFVTGLLAAGLMLTTPGWSLQSTPDPAGGAMLSVSCISATACTGTGDYTDVTGMPYTLVERH